MHRVTPLRGYVGLISAAGLVPLLWALASLAGGRIHPLWFVLAAVTFVSGKLAIRVSSIQLTVSLSEAFIFAAVLLFGPAAGALTAALDGLVVWAGGEKRRVDRLLFNVSEPTLSIWIAAAAFYAIADVPPLLGQRVELTRMLPALVAMTGSYFAVNTMLTALVVRLESRTSPAAFLRDHVRHLALDFCVGLSFGVIVVQNTASLGLGAIFVVLPLLISSYMSSRTIMGRLEDTHQHLTDLQRLYDATIETLAMAVDAKDQVTHGHIRRVQIQCRQVAAAVGIADPLLLRALDAAGLLHDIGKIAVPEHILNKPGPLTPAEFEQMKVHAPAGADLLTRIQFPFPVADIVRHHHENWDGTGYPDGIAGEAIPIGARILSVVDCFDALISDRPYRRSMSREEAKEVIRSRRGRMYDPAVVDVFFAKIVNQQEENSAEHADIRPQEKPAAATSPEPAKIALMSSLRSEFSGLSVPALAARVRIHVAATIPDCVALLYRYASSTDELICDVVPQTFPDTEPLKVRPGAGITGWVAANRRPMANSDASLDLPELASRHTPPLSVCISIPVVKASSLVGVVTVYSSNHVFSERDRIQIEELAAALAEPLATASGDSPVSRSHTPTAHVA